jgi:hypothetical protein
MRKLLVLAFFTASFGIAAACGGKVVLDTGSSSGTGAVGTGSTGSAGTAGGSCVPDPPAPGSLSQCSSAASSSGGPETCDSAFCDNIGQTWIASCQNNGCECQFQGPATGGQAPVMTLCACTLPGGADACTTGTNCCGFSAE